MASRGLALLTRKDETAHLVERVRALREATDLCAGRVSDEVVAEAERVIAQTDRRLTISGAGTVVALAGATGSGKSSMFNALSGTNLATVGVRRPTTSSALACSWGDESAEELLDWLRIPRRHALEPDPAMAAALDGLVLLDLPDHDSTELSHRMEVDRLVQLVDMLIWVVDPQKYADAALHDRYLIPLATYADVMMVVLNQVDRLTPSERDQCLRDLRRLLSAEGIDGIEVLAVSAVTGEGMDELRSRLAKAVAEKKAAARRLAADVGAVASRLSSASGMTKTAPVSRQSIDRMNKRLADAAGVTVVTEAVGNAWRLRGGLATGWPVLAWVAKFKPDPLRRLHLDRLGAGRKQKEIDPSRVGRTSLPATSGVQKARVDTAIRALADETAEGLNRGWADAIKARCPLLRWRPARHPRPGGCDDGSGSRSASQLVAGGPGAAVVPDRRCGRWPRLARLGLRLGLSAVAAVARSHLVGLSRAHRVGRRWSPRRPAGRWAGPHRDRGGRQAAVTQCDSRAAPLDRQGHPRAGGRPG